MADPRFGGSALTFSKEQVSLIRSSMFIRVLAASGLLCIPAVNGMRAQQVFPPYAGAGTASTPAVLPQEDWTRLPVDRATLKPIIPGLPMEKAETPAYSREMVRLEWRRGDPIDIYIVRPHGAQKPRVVLYLYSFPFDTDRFIDDGWCRRVTRDGLAAVGFVSALTGERFRNRPMREWFISELQESMGSSAHDVQLILDYLASRGDLSVDKAAMWGQGSGASIAILAASADSRLAVLDLLNPWGDWPDWLKGSPVVPDEERAKYLTADFLDKASRVDPVDDLPLLKDREYRIQQVLDDADTPPAARDRIAAQAPPAHLVRYADRKAHREAWAVTGITGWIAAQLRDGGSPASAPAAASR